MKIANCFRWFAQGAPVLALATACSNHAPTSAPIDGVGTASAPLSIPQPPSITTFVVYASQRVSLGAGDHTLGGDVGVGTMTGPTPALTVGNLDGLDLTRTLFAPSISVGSLAVVGSVDTSSLTNGGGVVGIQSAYPAAMPALPMVFDAAPGAQNVTVAAGQSTTLNPGNYGVLTDNGNVYLNPGTYSFSSVVLGNNAQLLAQPGGATNLRVAGSLSTGTFVKVLPLLQSANAFTIDVSGGDGANGSAPAISIGGNAQVVALLAAPNGTVSFGNGVQATGAFAGSSVIAGTSVLFTFQNGFASATPTISSFVAYAAQSVSFGAGDHVIGGDVGVAAAAPTFGTQLAVGTLTAIDPLRTIYSPSVSLGSLAVVGDVGADTMISSGAVSGTQAPYPGSAMPRLPLAPAGIPGTTNVTVAPGQIQTINPGNFGALTDNGILNLKPGSYSFSSVAVGNGAQLIAQLGGSTTIRIAGALSTGTFAKVFPLAQPAGALTISVSGADGQSGSPPAVSLGANTQLVGLLTAPNGTLSFGNNTSATGAFAAFSIVAAANVTLLYQSGLPAQSQQPAGQQPLSGYITPDLAVAPLVGPVPPSTPMTLALSLPVRAPSDFPTLADFATQVSDPASSRYRQFLTPADYATHYRPSANDYGALTTFAQSYGLSVVRTHPDQELLDVSGTVGQVEQLLNAQLNFYLRPDGTQFYGPDREPSLALSVPILHISGTNNFLLPTPRFAGTGTSGRFFGKDYRNAYLPACAKGLDGAGQSVAIIGFQGFNNSDVDKYVSKAGLPGGNDVIRLTYSAGGIDGNDSLVVNGSQEGPLDVENVIAMAPAVTIVYYQSPDTSSNLGQDLQSDLLHDVAHPRSGVPLSLQVSLSYALVSESDSRQYVDTMAAQGQSFFDASGDGGAFTGNSRDDRSYDHVTFVGGTTIGSGAGLSEQGWSGSGGGFLGAYTVKSGPSGKAQTTIKIDGVGIPSYQTAFVNSTNLASPLFRNFPDVAMVASSIDIFYTTSKGVQANTGVLGTSASAPLFAGFMALVNQKASADGVASVGFANPALYGIAGSGALYAQSFNDITTGTNPPVPSASGGFGISATGSPPPAGGFSAVVGYDLVTGLGSPTCGLLNQLASATPLIPVPPPAPPPAPLTIPPAFVGLGGDDACGLVNGGVECWGQDFDGENGSGINGNVDTTQHLTPACTQMANQGAAAGAVAMGDRHACAVFQGGLSGVWCWGDNSVGQCGANALDINNQPLPNSTAQAIAGLPNNDVLTQISAGGGTTCVLFAAGDVWCWGANDRGQLGNGSTNSGPNANPAPVQNLPPAAQIVVATGGRYVCAVLKDGTLDCWGGNDFGNLGNGTVQSSATPAPVTHLGTPLANVATVSAGDQHACALIGQPSGNVSAGLWCWGDNKSAELGEGRIDNGTTPTHEFGAISATEVNGCNTGCSAPVQVSAVTCGDGFTCVLVADGTVQCWGTNSLGQLGSGAASVTFNPNATAVPGLSGVTAVAAGSQQACAQTSNGGLSCWGAGPVGNGTTGTVATPTPVTFRRCP